MMLEPSDLDAIARAVAQHLQQLESMQQRLGNPERLAYPETEAAQLLGLPQHVLRDARLRGDYDKRIGKRFVYGRKTLLELIGGKPK